MAVINSARSAPYFSASFTSVKLVVTTSNFMLKSPLILLKYNLVLYLAQLQSLLYQQKHQSCLRCASDEMAAIVFSYIFIVSGSFKKCILMRSIKKSVLKSKPVDK